MKEISKKVIFIKELTNSKKKNLQLLLKNFLKKLKEEKKIEKRNTVSKNIN